jgi:DDE superfamily endonuclease
VILCTPEKQILFATTSTEGAAHDKAIADDAEMTLSARVVILADSGFQGLSAGKATVLLPCKKPHGKDHPQHHRQWNTLFARVRVKVEHALANVKTFRIVKETIRLKTAQCRDLVFELACGLANLRLRYPKSKL